jgi:UDPglucose--hexose-1-phosphate uridylyltransferase
MRPHDDPSAPAAWRRPAHPAAPGELRRDPLTGRWVVLASGRAARPAAFHAPADPPETRDPCPLCPGNERLTPPEVWAVRDGPGGAGKANGPGWRVRVVPNKYPAFAGPIEQPSGELDRAAAAGGGQEVIAHGPDHAATLADQDEAQVALVLAAWRRRLAAWRRQPLGALMVLVNQGRAAGASLEHPHSQLFATGLRPDLVRAEVERLTSDDCAACATLDKERGGERIVTDAGADADALVTLCPWASALPYEALLLPARHLPRFEDADGRADLALARELGGLLRRLEAATGPRTPYNLVLHTAPPGLDDFHWHLHLLPRLTVLGGFELGGGMIINVVDPDAAARSLRGAPADRMGE